MRTRSLAAVALAAVALLLAGCSDEPGGATTSSPTSTASRAEQGAAMLAVSRCMRSHGYPNFPDPVQGASGDWDWPPSTDRMQATGECEQLLRQAKAADRRNDRQKVDAATLAKLRRYAQCMREHGLPDWPDPNGAGAFKLPPRLQSSKAAGSLLEQPDRQCHQFAPVSGIAIEQERG